MNCPVCCKPLDSAHHEISDMTCRTMDCPMYSCQQHKEFWKFLTSAIDQQSDAVQIARKAITRLSTIKLSE